MGNITIEKINDIDIATGFERNYPMVKNGDMLSKISGQEGRVRVFNMDTNIPPDGVARDNDYFCDVDISEKDSWIRIDAKNVRTGDWWYIQKKAGTWGNWIKLINQTQMDNALDSKVDKDGARQLSEQNYTLEEKQKVANSNTHFRGYYQTSAELVSISNKVKGDYAVVGGVEPSMWVCDGTEFIDTQGKMFGDMLKSIYAPNTTGDLADRINHHGEQEIETIHGLSKVLNAKLNVDDKTKVIDNFNSTNPLDALSANMGGVLQQNILSILSGNSELLFKGKVEQDGYIKIGQLTIQWGRKNMGVGKDNTTLELQFNTPFKATPFVVVATPVAKTSSGSGGDFCSAEIIDNNCFWLVKDYATNSNSTDVQWLAIGV